MVEIPINKEELQFSLNLIELGFFVLFVYLGKQIFDLVLSKWWKKNQEEYVTIGQCKGRRIECRELRSMEESMLSKRLGRLERVIFHVAMKLNVDEDYLYSIFSEDSPKDDKRKKQ